MVIHSILHTFFGYLYGIDPSTLLHYQTHYWALVLPEKYSYCIDPAAGALAPNSPKLAIMQLLLLGLMLGSALVFLFFSNDFCMSDLYV